MLIYFIFLLMANVQAFNLITTYYKETNPERVLEYKRCFEENVKNKYIKKIFVFYEKTPEEETIYFLSHKKIKIIPIRSRPTYKMYFDFANNHLKNQIVIIANTDIFFDASLNQLQGYNFSNKLLALTRYNLPEYKGAWKRHTKSHDSWIFKAPFKDIGANIKLGIPGCENELLNLCRRYNITIVNPSLTIKTWHVHQDDTRNYFGNAYKGRYTIDIPFTKL